MTLRTYINVITRSDPLFLPFRLILCPYLYCFQTPTLCLGDFLEDYPDSPGGDGGLSREAASRILDSEDSMETGHAGSSNPPGLGDSPSVPSGPSGRHKRPLHYSQRQSGAADNKGPKTGPTLPPIYHSVLRKKLAKMTVRHLDGGACKDPQARSPLA
jgi:hypothetical protein